MDSLHKFLALISVFVIMVIMSSCVNDDDYVTPNLIVTDPELIANATFKNIIARYIVAVDVNENGFVDEEEAGLKVGIFDLEEAGIIIEGYVISSDKAGNFFEEIVIQNKVDGSTDINNPRLGFVVNINVRSLYETYEIGRKIYIKMNGLAIGESHGVFTIGKPEGDRIGQIQEFEYKDFIIRDPEVVTIIPKNTTISELTEADENTLIQLENMQIHRNSTAFTYAGEASDEFDGFRTLESCNESNSIALQTSTFADFKSIQLPQNKGTIQAIFTRDFGDDTNVLIINSTSDLSFDNPERCDPEFLECSGEISTGMIIFEEDFQTITNENQLDDLGWTNINVSGGSERFEDSSFGSNRYLKISAFGTGENPLEAWLITPTINLDSTTQEELSFKISSNFETGQVLTAFITENYTGDPLTTEWIFLDANIPIGNGGFGNFVASNINISCLNGNVHIAFKYLGAAGGAETRYHIDDIKVTGM